MQRSAMIAIGCVMLSRAAFSQEAEPKLDPRERSFLYALRDAHNAERKKESKPPLSLAPRLVEAARIQAKDMAARKEMSHEGSDGSTVDVRVKRVGYRFIRTGENVAAGHKTIAHVVKDWMGSEGHRANILGDFAEMGAARVEGEDDINYWCVVFGTPIPKVDVAAAPAEALESLNRTRREKEMKPLAASAELNKVAQAAADELAQSESKPPSLDYKRVYEKVNDEGYRYSKINLSLASGVYTAADLIQSLAESPEADKSVLGAHEDAGIGVAVDSDGVAHWVLLLGSRQKKSGRD